MTAARTRIRRTVSVRFPRSEESDVDSIDTFTRLREHLAQIERATRLAEGRDPYDDRVHDDVSAGRRPNVETKQEPASVRDRLASREDEVLRVAKECQLSVGVPAEYAIQDLDSI